jgi:hypothetical protein
MPKDTSSGQILVSQAYLMLNNLQNKLLIDRIAITRGFPQSGQRLLNTALELMDLTNMFWIKRDQLMIFSSAFEWIVSTRELLQVYFHLTQLSSHVTGFLQQESFVLSY